MFFLANPNILGGLLAKAVCASDDIANMNELIFS